MKKITPKPSADIGEPPEIEWFDPEELAADPRYQRDHDRPQARTLIRSIVENFHWNKFQPPTVTYVEATGAFMVVDGMHRVLAARLHPLVEKIPCTIIDADELKRQADSFLSINRNRAKVHTLQVFKAGLIAENPEDLHVKSVCDQAGVSIPAAPSTITRPRMTSAVGTIRRTLKTFGDGPVVAALRAFVEAFPERPNQIRAVPLDAVVRIFAANRDVIDAARFARLLRGHDMADLESRSRIYAKDFNVRRGNAIRTMLVNEYNRGHPREDRLS